VARFIREIRPYPGRWIGVCCAYNTELINFFKAQPIKAWDAQTKTWWFPESVEPIISAEMVRLNVLTREKASAFSKEFYAHQQLGTADEPYAILGIKPGSPRALVDLVYAYWKRQFSSVGGAGTQLEEVEHAYAEIVGAT